MFITELDFYEMTWGDLRRFVEMGNHIDDSEQVDFATDPFHGNGEPAGLRVYHDAGGAPTNG